jgi:hypothetical protein
MAGFDNDTMFAGNVDFRGVEPVVGQVTADGQLLIGATASPNIRVGSLASSNASVLITVGAGTIDLKAGATVATTYQEDSGSAVPIANILNIFGLSGSKTSGAGGTVTIKSPSYADFPATSTATINSGSFITAGGNIILNLPATAADGDLIEVVCTTANLVAIDAPALNFVRIGTLVTSGGGTATSTQIGDAVCLRYRLADLTWYATSVIGTWVMA